MSRRSILILIFAIFLFISCGVKQDELSLPKLNQDNLNENYLLLEALLNEYYDLNQTRSLEIFTDFYKRYKSYPYLNESLRLSLQSYDGQTSDRLLKDGLKRFPQKNELKKLYISRLLQKKKYEEAKNQTLKLLKIEKTSENYMLLGSIYYLLKDYNRAYVYYKKSYTLVSNETTLLKLVSILDVNLNKNKKAIEYFESYIRLRKSSKEVYFRLLQIYSKNFDIKGLISTYKLLYRDFGENVYAKKIVELYIYAKDKKGAIDFLKKSAYNQSMLLDIYVQEGKFKQAYLLAKKMYKKSKNLDLLGRMAIYQYEADGDKLSKKTLLSISKKFEYLLEKKQNPLYLNYYGYLLIDHDMDIQKGIKYVQMALEQEPNSAYYLDSLAWGYYKLGEHAKALEIMEKIIKTNKEKEILEHYRIIKNANTKF